MKFRPLTVLAAVPLFLAVACGGDDEQGGSPSAAPTPSEEAEFPVTVGAGDSAVEIPEQPQKIVSLSPSATEMLFAIDAGDQVVAVDEYSNYPDDAPTTKLSGFEPNVEAIAGYQPDLVLAESDPSELKSGLDALDIPTLIVPSATKLDDTYTQIGQLGAATGHVAEAADLVATMQQDIKKIVADIPSASNDAEPVTYYHELDPNLYSVTSDTFIGQVYELAGMKSVADDAPDAAGGYPQVSPEFVVTKNPDVIFFADGGDGGVTPDDIAGRPGWDKISAVRNDRIVEVDPDVASRWGPRVVDFLRTVVDERTALQPTG